MKYSKNKNISILCGIFSICLIWLLWEYLLPSSGWKNARIFPPPTSIIRDVSNSGFKIGIGSQAASIPESILSSVFRVFAGLAFGFIASLFAGIFLSTSIWIRRFFLPVIQLLAPIAPIAWIPLALVLFEIGNQIALFIVFMGVFFTITIASVEAIRTVPENLVNAARTLGSSNFQIWRHVIFPHMLPTVFTMLRINFIAAWGAVLAAEMTGIRDGLGAIIMTGRNLFDYNWILLGMCLIGLSGFFVDIILQQIQRTFVWWGDK